ncbi:MAG: MBL fold metallo-hydrolase [Thermoleophilia bacterium]
MELVVLGSGGWMPRGGRATTSLALRTKDSLVILDAGTGIARLLDPVHRRLTSGVDEVDILLSHLHLDHTVGLSFLPALLPGRRVRIHVPEDPGAGYGGYDPLTVLDRLVGPPFFPHGFSDFPLQVEVRSLRSGSFTVAGLEVQARLQPHPGGSLGFRVGDELAFLTDTVFDPGAAGFVRRVGVLVHEAWIRGEEDDEALKKGLSAHTSAEQAAKTAQEAGTGELLLSHLTPLRDESFHAGMLAAARAIFPRTHLCEDGLSRLLA